MKSEVVIVHLVNTYQQGSVAKILGALSGETYNDLRHVVVALEPPARPLPAEETLPVIVVGGRYQPRVIASAVQLQSAGAKQCVLHAHMGWSTVVAPWICQWLNLPGILTFHSELHRYNRGVRWGVKAGATFRRKLLFNGVSETVAKQWSGFLRRSVETVYNPMLLPLVEWPRPYSSQGSLKLVAVARLTALKNLAFALRVVVALRQRGLACIFTIVGDGPERLSLERYVDDLRLRDVVQFVGYQSEVSGYLDASDIFLLPSHAEGFCLAAVEAMARGCPVMTHSGLGGVCEFVKDADTGIVNRGLDENEWVGRLSALDGDRNKLRGLGARARERASVFRPNAMAQGYAKLYRKALEC